MEVKIDDLELLLSGLSQALVLYGDLVSADMFGCQISLKIERHLNKIGLKTYEERHEYLAKRYKAILDLYQQLDNKNKEKVNETDN